MDTYVIKFLTGARAKTPKFCEIEADTPERAANKFFNQTLTTILLDVYGPPLPKEEWQQ
jgi:hypothetical protein